MSLCNIIKGQLISKANQSSQELSQKTNENTSHSSKNESSAWQFAFEINWPLPSKSELIHKNFCLYQLFFMDYAGMLNNILIFF